MQKLTLIFLGIIFTITSCVSTSKFESEQAHVKKLQTDSTSNKKNLKECNAKVAGLEKDKSQLQKDLDALSSSSKLTLEEREAALKNSQMTIADQAKRLKDLQDMLQAQKDVMGRLKKKITDALANFKPDELSVSTKDGKIYVSLQEKLLFKSGSATVDPKGKEALQSLAAVLVVNQDIAVAIEGHTDSIPMKSEKFQDNWSLSTERATSIVRILTKDYKLDAHNIVATGKSEFYPIAENTTPEGRAKNRRIEIILSPNLSELFTLLNQ